MILKQTKSTIKDLSEGVVVAYPNVYNVEDSDRDISMPGSYRKTVNEGMKKIRVFQNHDRNITLGVPLEIDTDDEYGLLTKTKFNMNKAVSRDMFTDIQLFMEHGQDADMSVGVIDIKRGEDDYRKVYEWKLLEYSFLTSWGANEFATVRAIKSAKDPKRIVEMIKKSYDLDYSDDRLIQIETILKALEAAPHFEPQKDNNDAINNLIKYLKS